MIEELICWPDTILPMYYFSYPAVINCRKLSASKQHTIIDLEIIRLSEVNEKRKEDYNTT